MLQESFVRIMFLIFFVMHCCWSNHSFILATWACFNVFNFFDRRIFATLFLLVYVCQCFYVWTDFRPQWLVFLLFWKGLCEEFPDGPRTFNTFFVCIPQTILCDWLYRDWQNYGLCNYFVTSGTSDLDFYQLQSFESIIPKVYRSVVKMYNIL